MVFGVYYCTACYIKEGSLQGLLVRCESGLAVDFARSIYVVWCFHAA